MSKLRKEIKACMSKLNIIDKTKVTADFCFKDNFIGFKGHFPDNPVLPGACQIQAAILMFEEYKKKSAELREVRSAKFFLPVRDNQKVRFLLEEIPQGSGVSLIKVILQREAEKAAELHLRLAF